MSKSNFVVTGSPDILFDAEEIVVDNAFYRLSITLSVPEIFALKLKSCPK